jgi:hypothetical protein
MDTLDDKIKVKPENNARLPIPSDSFCSIIHLKFDFFKMNFRYTFFGLNILVNKLGGSSGAAKGVLV